VQEEVTFVAEHLTKEEIQAIQPETRPLLNMEIRSLLHMVETRKQEQARARQVREEQRLLKEIEEEGNLDI